jgi:CheY-like chemotaxis protein
LIHIRLFHWNITEAEQKTLILKSLGYEVDYEPYPPKALKQLRDNPPAAVIIDLSRLPSQGRDIAVNILHAKATRNIPIIFVEGDSQKVQQIKMHVPDAIYTRYDQIDEALRKAFTDPPKVKLIPKTIFEPYKRTSLTKKLGIKPNSRLVLVDPPDNFTKTLGKLPQNVTIQNRLSSKSDVVILFAVEQESLRSQIIEIINELPSGGKLWIAWRKQGSETATNVTQATVRKTGLALELVDYKICRIDSEWTALLFTRRKNKNSTSAPT